MTQSQGEMRELHPETGVVYRYRIEERESYFTFDPGRRGTGRF